MVTTREIRVQATKPGVGNGISSSKDAPPTVTQLSDLDLLMPKINVHMIEVFSLPPDADKQQIICNLTHGLSLTLADYPILAGTLHFDNDAKRIVVKTGPNASVGLSVRDSGPDGGEDVGVPSFSQLDRDDFSIHLVDRSRILPASFAGPVPVPADDLSAAGPPVCGCQVTFIEGGLILGLVVTHQVCDGPGSEAVLTHWARHARAISEGSPHGAPRSSSDVFPGRDILTHKGAPMSSREAWAELGSKFPTNKPREGPPAPRPAAGPGTAAVVATWSIWHFPQSRLAELKRLCSRPGARVSRYDALLALLWRASVRAKQPLLRPRPGTPVKAIHAVNARGRTAPAIPASYIGVAVTMPESPALTVADVLAPDVGAVLPLLARTIRAATSCVTPEYVADLAKFAANAPDLRWTVLDSEFFFGSRVVVGVEVCFEHRRVLIMNMKKIKNSALGPWAGLHGLLLARYEVVLRP